MGVTAEEQAQQQTALEPKGPALPKVPESNWAKLKLALGEEFARVELRALDLLREADPRTAYEMLEEWEDLADLPDCFTLAESSLDARRSALLERLTRTGGQSKAYMIDRAAALGHDITITQAKISTSGGLKSGDELSADHANRYAWKVNVAIDPTNAFQAGGSTAGDRLGYWAPVRLECLLDRVKPAQTKINWNYIV